MVKFDFKCMNSDVNYFFSFLNNVTFIVIFEIFLYVYNVFVYRHKRVNLFLCIKV